jgi:hypothetical protein
MLKATHEGTLSLGGIFMPCVVLEDETRLLTDYGFLTILGLTEFEDTVESLDSNLPSFLRYDNLQPFISQDLKNLLMPISYIALDGTEKFGYRAETLPEVCCVYVDAAGQGVLKKNQKIIGQRCSQVLLTLVKRGQKLLEKMKG